MNKKNNRKGFTTVELVIVIAVIAILATVLIPTFSNLITSANKTAALQDANSIYKSYCVAQPVTFGTKTVYVKVTDSEGVTQYFKGEKGQLSEKAETAEPADTETVIEYSKDSGTGFKCVTPVCSDAQKDEAAGTEGKGKCDICGAAMS